MSPILQANTTQHSRIKGTEMFGGFSTTKHHKETNLFTCSQAPLDYHGVPPFCLPWRVSFFSKILQHGGAEQNTCSLLSDTPLRSERKGGTVPTSLVPPPECTQQQSHFPSQWRIRRKVERGLRSQGKFLFMETSKVGDNFGQASRHSLHISCHLHFPVSLTIILGPCIFVWLMV